MGSLDTSEPLDDQQGARAVGYSAAPRASAFSHMRM